MPDRLAAEILTGSISEFNEWRKSHPGPDLSQLELAGRDLTGANFSNCNLTRTVLTGAKLAKANFQHAILKGNSQLGLPLLDLRECDLRGASFQATDVHLACFADADLRQASFRRANLEGADLHWANLEGCDFRQANLRNTNLGFCNLALANLQRANLEGADLRVVNLHSADLLGANLRGVLFQWLKDATEMRAARNLLLAMVSEDLGAELGFPANHNENVAKLDFRAYNLEQANLESADFRFAVFDDTDFARANLHAALLNHTSLRGADLRDCDLTGANLTGSNLFKADLRGANIAGAVFTGANLQGTNLEGSIGLDAAQIRSAVCHLLALHDAEMLPQLQLAADHNEKVQSADFSGFNLSGASLQKAQLTGANFRGADLSNASLDEACLCEARLDDANLENASLVKADLKGAVLAGARLRDADLRDADLHEIQILSTRQLAGTNVSGAKLPDNVKSFDALQSIRESSENSRKIFVSMLLLAVYSWLTIGATRDAALLTSTGTMQLPIIQSQIPIGWFYWITPIMLLGIFLYFHFYLQNLWEELAQLPAWFPDGRPLHQRVYPWLVNSIARVHFQRLRTERGLFANIQYAVTVMLTWWVVPITQVVFWLRYLPRHEWVGTALHIVLAVLTFGVALLFLRLAGNTLEGKSSNVTLRSLIRADSLAVNPAIPAIVFGLILSICSFGAIEGGPGHASVDPRSWMQGLFKSLHISYAAQLAEEDISSRPSNWTEREPNFEGVKGAHLVGRDLRYAEAHHAFLVKAELSGANLEHADLREADLRKAILSGASLRGANLTGAHLDEARLDGCDLRDTIGATLSK